MRFRRTTSQLFLLQESGSGDHIGWRYQSSNWHAIDYCSDSTVSVLHKLWIRGETEVFAAGQDGIVAQWDADADCWQVLLNEQTVFRFTAIWASDAALYVGGQSPDNFPRCIRWIDKHLSGWNVVY